MLNHVPLLYQLLVAGDCPQSPVSSAALNILVQRSVDNHGASACPDHKLFTPTLRIRNTDPDPTYVTTSICCLHDYVLHACDKQHIIIGAHPKHTSIGDSRPWAKVHYGFAPRWATQKSNQSHTHATTRNPKPTRKTVTATIRKLGAGEQNTPNPLSPSLVLDHRYAALSPNAPQAYNACRRRRRRRRRTALSVPRDGELLSAVPLEEAIRDLGATPEAERLEVRRRVHQVPKPVVGGTPAEGQVQRLQRGRAVPRERHLSRGFGGSVEARRQGGAVNST